MLYIMYMFFYGAYRSSKLFFVSIFLSIFVVFVCVMCVCVCGVCFV